MGRTVLLLLITVLVGCSRPAPQLSARFEVPDLVGSQEMSYRVTITNAGPSRADDLAVVSQLGESLERIEVGHLDVGETRTLEGSLAVVGEESSLSFSARVLGEGVLLRSQVVTVRRSAGVGGQEALAYSQASSQQVLQQNTVTPDQIGDLPDLPPRPTFGSLEPVPAEQDVSELIARVEKQDCQVSKKLLEQYRHNGNRRADQFLLGSR